MFSDNKNDCAGWTVVHMMVSSHMYVGGHMTKIGQWGVRAFGTDPKTVRRGYDSPSSKSRSVY